ncbi:MAG: hypothetical protein ACFFB3_18845 [Candidatus Hodarchaeota archaeon]
MNAKLLKIGMVALIVMILGASTLYIGLLLYNNDANSENAPYIVINEDFLYYDSVNITWLGQAEFKFETKELLLCVDPFTFTLVMRLTKPTL